MTAEQYARMTAPFRAHPELIEALRIASKALTALGYLAYPALLICVFMAGSTAHLVRFVAVPAIMFIAVSVFRHAFNAPRPYEALSIEPLIPKDTQGKSFPSRHTFSMALIAVSWLAWSFPVGCALLVAAAFMAAVRVLGGVHFPRDVIAGAAIALIAGAVGYVAIPL